jgi:hypothetical protein
LTDVDLEVVRAEVTRLEFEKQEERRFYSWAVLGLLMLVQISSLLTKFIIGAAYNYQGDNDD